MRFAVALFISYFFFTASVQSQISCLGSLKGRVISTESSGNLAFAYVYIKGSNQSAQTDSLGNFSIKNICPGNYTLVAEMTGFDKKETSITFLNQQLKIENFSLKTHNEHLYEIFVEAKKSASTSQLNGKLTQEERSQRDGLGLGEMMKGIVGVQSLQTGSTISKPIIHGLHSARVIILNQGVRQEGQQWGSEHAPEVDPFVSQNIQVIKGPAGLRYGGDAIGGIVMMEPNALPDSNQIRGSLQSIYFTNGQQFVESGLIEGGIGQQKGWGWRLQGTLKNGGNISTAHYDLANTGVREQNFSSAIGYHQIKWGTDVFISVFQSTIGIYAGSHIGNVNDLENAISSSVPASIFTPTHFIREIERPNQDVFHSLAKIKGFYKLDNNAVFRSYLAYQYNQRLEFDVMRLGKNVNTLRFNLETLSSELLFDESSTNKHWKGQFGITILNQGNITSGNRVNIPTLTTSLLPNYYLSNVGLFALERYVNSKLELDFGLRLDAKNIEIHRPDINYSPRIKRNENDYVGLSASAGLKYHWLDHLENHLIFARAFRAPGPNELFSNGVHHGAGAYEIGDPTLRGETAYNVSLNTLFSLPKIEIEIGLYQNYIHHFIYLKPMVENNKAVYVTTIRGAFPAFSYDQIDANFSGIDGQITYKLSSQWSITQKTSLVRAFDTRNNNYIVNIPPDRFEYIIRHQFKKESHYISAGITQVSTQTRVEVNSDYSNPPKGYFLVQLHWAYRWNKIDLGISVTNALNQAYRDYLNRFRYFADDQGRNVSARMTYHFG